MRKNRFFKDLDTSKHIEWLIEHAQKECNEDYILNRIKTCNNRPDMRVYSYESACDYSIDLLRALYVRGDSIESMRPTYLVTRERLRLLDESIRAQDYKEKTKLVDAINTGILIAVGHALGENREEIGRNTRAISPGYDLFIDRLLRVYDSERPLSNDLRDRQVYYKLYRVFDTAPEERPDLIASYLDHWEKLVLKGNKYLGALYPCPERLQGEWQGYWCYPAAGVVAALNIDDSSFIDHDFYPSDLMRACARHRGAPVVLPPVPHEGLPPAPTPAPQRKAAPALLEPRQALFDAMVVPLPESLQNILWNAMIQWLEDNWEGEKLGPGGFLCALSNAEWDANLSSTYRRHVLLHVDWKDDDSALDFCADMARTVGIDDEFVPDTTEFDSPHRVWEVLYTFHQWLLPRGYRLLSPDAQEDAYYAFLAKEEQAASLASAIEQAGLPVRTFANDEPF